MVALVLGTALSTLGLAPLARADGTVAELDRYCTACWRNARLQPDSWNDCTQEVFLRLVERVPVSSWHRILADQGPERRELLRAIDMVKKRNRRARPLSRIAGPCPDPREPRLQQRQAQRQALLQAANQHLTDRQARILAMTLDGWSVSAVADKLGLSTARVSDEKYKAIRRLRHLAQADLL